MKSIAQALLELDVTNDKLWTEGGVPTVEAVANALGAPVSRSEIIDAAPKFTRHTPILPPGTVPYSNPDAADVKVDLSEPLPESDLHPEVVACDREISNIEAEILKLTQSRDKLIVRRDAIVDKLESTQSVDTNQRRISRFLEAQKAKGVPTGGGVKSALDKAYARPTGRPAPTRRQAPSAPPRSVTQ